MQTNIYCGMLDLFFRICPCVFCGCLCHHGWIHFVIYLNVICAILFNHLSTTLTAIINLTVLSRKVQFTLEQATKAQRGSLLFL
jgi:hypothetical protein